MRYWMTLQNGGEKLDYPKYQNGTLWNSVTYSLKAGDPLQRCTPFITICNIIPMATYCAARGFLFSSISSSTALHVVCEKIVVGHYASLADILLSINLVQYCGFASLFSSQVFRTD